jgi:outer membrane protein assembly factor BamA
MFADLRGYWQAGSAITLASAVSLGYAQAYGQQTRVVPPQARYYIGSEGFRPVRGYPTDTIGGTVALVVNLFELRVPVYKWVGVTLFSDGGQQGETAGAITPGAFRWVAGPGISVTTPLGELRADFPWRLNDRPGWGTPFFSLGSAF